MKKFFVAMLFASVGVSAFGQVADVLPSRPKHDTACASVVEPNAASGALSNAVAEYVANVADPADQNAIVACAKKYLGRPYAHGATGPKSFDCSGFTRFVYDATGLAKLSRVPAGQYKQGKPITRISDMRPGDLVFFTGRSLSQKWGHVGIVVSAEPDGSKFKFIHANNRGVTIDESTMGYYKSRYVGCCRVL